MYAAQALVVEHIAPAPAVSNAAPASVGEYICPIRAVCAAPGPVVKYIALAPTPEVRHATAAATVFAAPVPLVQYNTTGNLRHASADSYDALAVVRYITPAPAVSHAAPKPTMLTAPAPVLEYIFQRLQ